MEYLTNRQLLKLAPGAARRPNAAKEKLLCTATFLAGLEPLGYRPAFALQGTTHEDSQYEPRDGRHLVVASRDDGVCISLLNSHCRLLRVWVGVGLWSGEELLLGLTLPVQRWKGAQAQLEQFQVEDWPAKLTEQQAAMKLQFCDTARTNSMVKWVAKRGYIVGRGRPSVDALFDAVPDTTADVFSSAFAIVGAARRGNLKPSTGDRRNVKGIRRPDALHHLAKVAYAAAVGAL